MRRQSQRPSTLMQSPSHCPTAQRPVQVPLPSLKAVAAPVHAHAVPLPLPDGAAPGAGAVAVADAADRGAGAVRRPHGSGGRGRGCGEKRSEASHRSVSIRGIRGQVRGSRAKKYRKL
eukprot:TRINITY_DN1879_c0_g1_i12.p3 TRINITY_DN1879_c0_g1~~TRINITY_DN1879_c0_g1_i12.p3  ORF type:complete len:118 (-),score=0.71 TRINITY_DN1879_c0_g1_i12:1-354(-)